MTKDQPVTCNKAQAAVALRDQMEAQIKADTGADLVTVEFGGPTPAATIKGFKAGVEVFRGRYLISSLAVTP
mgnify:CR=1 FL=1